MDIHVFSNIGGIIESSVVEPAQKIAFALSANLIPFVAGGITIWVMVYALATARGAVQLPLNDFTWRVVKISLITFFGIAGGIFQADAHGFYNEISNAIYNAVNLGSSGNCPVPANDTMGVYGALDCAAGEIFSPILDSVGRVRQLIAPPGADIFDKLSNVFTNLPFIIISFLMLIVAVLLSFFLLIYAGFEIISVRVMLALALALSPLFIFALAFEPIKNFFSNWLNVVIKSIILQALFIAFIGVAFGAVSQIQANLFQFAANLEIGAMLIAIIINNISFIILLGIFIFTASRIPSLAAELCSGGSSGAGLGTLLTAAAAKNLGKWTAGKLGSKPNPAGGTIES